MKEDYEEIVGEVLEIILVENVTEGVYSKRDFV